MEAVRRKPSNAKKNATRQAAAAQARAEREKALDFAQGAEQVDGVWYLDSSTMLAPPGGRARAAPWRTDGKGRRQGQRRTSRKYRVPCVPFPHGARPAVMKRRLLAVLLCHSKDLGRHMPAPPSTARPHSRGPPCRGRRTAGGGPATSPAASRRRRRPAADRPRCPPRGRPTRRRRRTFPL